VNVIEVARAYFSARLIVAVRDTADPKDIRNALVDGRGGAYSHDGLCWTTGPKGVTAWWGGGDDSDSMLYGWPMLFATVRGAGTAATLEALRRVLLEQKCHDLQRPVGPDWVPHCDQTPEYLATLEAFRADLLWPHADTMALIGKRVDAARDAFWESGRGAPVVGQLDLLDMLVGAS
jgi:hypothetical protein